MPVKRLGFWLLFELLLLSAAAAQLPPVETFSVDEGLPSPLIYAMAQHPSGRLWILSNIGPLVFEGRTFEFAPRTGLPQTWGFQLLAIDEQGTVCMASTGLQSVFRWEGERWRRLPLPGGEASATPLTSLTIGRSGGAPYIALGSQAGLWLWSGRQWNRLRGGGGLPGDHVYGLVDLEDTIVVATSGGLCWLEKDGLGEPEPMCTVRREDPRLADPILALAPAYSSLGVWLLSADWLGFLAHGKLTVHQKGLGISPELPSRLLADPCGGVYFGNQDRLYYFEPATVPKPYLRVPAGVLRSLGATEGLVADGATALVLDREGNVWVGSDQGLSRIRSRRFLSWRLTGEVTAIVERRPGCFVLGQRGGGLSFLEEGRVRTLTLGTGQKFSDTVLDLAAEADGTVWIAANELGLWRLGGDDTLRRESSFDREAVAVEIDADGRLWVASLRQVYIRRGEAYEPFESFSSTKIRWLTAGGEGRLYVSTETRGLAIFRADEGWREVRGATAESNFVIGVLPEVSGTVWVGTSGGLHELRDNELVPVPLGESYLRKPVFMIFRDPDGRLWLGTDDGMWVWDGVRLRQLGFDQGLVGRETNRGAGIVDSRGYVWIGTDRGLSVYEKRYDREPGAVPIVELAGFEVNGREWRPSGLPLKLTHDENNLTWRLGTIAFSREAGVTARYRLEGFDKGWLKGGTSKKVSYTNLPPGKYRFHIAAGWDGGAWGEEVASDWVEILPPLWRRPWFLVLLAAAAAGVVLGVHRLRLRALRKRNAELVALTERLKRAVADKDRIFVEILRAESPAHLAALRDELRKMEQSDEHEDIFLHAEFFSDLRRMVEGLESLERLPSSEDRAYVLGQALTRALSLQERLKDDGNGKPALGGMALKTVEEIFSTALLDVQRHAELELELRSRHLTAHREATVVLEVKNTGRGDARDVEVDLDADEAALNVTRPRQVLGSLRRGQSAQLEFLVEPHHSERVRLSFRVTWDDFLAPGDDPGRRQERRFADVVELRRFQEPAVFRPLRPNPYVVGRPLLDMDLFYGREELFGRLATSLEGAAQDNVVILIGQRRMGKTSILRRLHRHLPETYVPVLVDLQGLLGEGEPAFFREVTGQVVDELEERGVRVSEPAPDDFEVDPGIFFRRRFLPRARGALHGRRLLLVFDEFEVLEERIRTGALTPQILPYLRSLMQHEKGVSFLLAGTHRLDDLTADYWGVLFNLAVYLEVGHLAASDVEALLVEPTSGSFEIDSLAQEKIYWTTGGHPHFSQLLGRELVDYANQHQISYVTVQDVNRVIETVAEKGQLHIAYLWQDATRDERLLLLAAKELLEREGQATAASVHRFLTGRGVDPGDLPEAARCLQRKEILTVEAGQLSFRIDLLRRWLVRHHDLETFVLSQT